MSHTTSLVLLAVALTTELQSWKKKWPGIHETEHSMLGTELVMVAPPPPHVTLLYTREPLPFKLVADAAHPL